ncbi:MAG: hypothetical protein K8R67_07800 [Desulfobacteraceae bacterium]|nr:hypothetical protein [Desulfobacteraceae bacterium]
MGLQRIIDSLKGVFLLNIVLLLLIFNTSIVFADFYIIAGNRGVGTKITSLPYEISSPGYYYIAENLSFAANNYDWIYIDFPYNVEIRTGTVRNFANNKI